MTSISSELTALKNDTAYSNLSTASTKSNDTTDYTMFLQLMLTQLENQDPTQPMDNTEWLAQLAQYSSLEQMTAMNSNMENIANNLNGLSSSMGTNAVISQTLSLVGKDVTVKTDAGNINGTVEEAKFDNGVGYVKVGDNYYAIANVTAIREQQSLTDAVANEIK